jgi:hypothetical protein
MHLPVGMLMEQLIVLLVGGEITLEEGIVEGMVVEGLMLLGVIVLGLGLGLVFVLLLVAVLNLHQYKRIEITERTGICIIYPGGFIFLNFGVRFASNSLYRYGNGVSYSYLSIWF